MSSRPRPPPRHPAIAAFVDHLRSAGKGSTAAAHGQVLVRFERWLEVAGIDLERATSGQLAGYPVWVGTLRHERTGLPLARTTQATAVVVVKSLYAWLRRRGRILGDTAATMAVPRTVRRLTVAKDHLSQQEVVALLQTEAALVEAEPPGTVAHARELRNLALIATALATGRRCQGLVDLRIDDVDLERGELRVAHEKGRMGRVLPVAAWCISILRRYLGEGRPLIPNGAGSPLLFPGRDRGRFGHGAVTTALDRAMRETIARNPDLADLPAKRITSHSLRVSFATMLFANGMNIRSLNELMLHSSLSTTAEYTPIPIEDMRRTFLASHPRA